MKQLPCKPNDSSILEMFILCKLVFEAIGLEENVALLRDRQGCCRSSRESESFVSKWFVILWHVHCLHLSMIRTDLCYLRL